MPTGPGWSFWTSTPTACFREAVNGRTPGEGGTASSRSTTAAGGCATPTMTLVQGTTRGVTSLNGASGSGMSLAEVFGVNRPR